MSRAWPYSRSLSASSGARFQFAEALGTSFERYGFAIVEDHGLDPGLIDRRAGRRQGLLRAARGGETSLHRARRGEPARLHAVRDRGRQGRRTCRPEGVLARRARARSGRARPRQRLAGRGAGFPRLGRRARTTPSMRWAQSCWRRSRFTSALSPVISTRRPPAATRSFACCTIHPSTARARRSAPARTRTSTPSRSCSAPRRPVSSCSIATGAGWRSIPNPARSSSTSATCSSG